MRLYSRFCLSTSNALFTDSWHIPFHLWPIKCSCNASKIFETQSDPLNHPHELHEKASHAKNFFEQVTIYKKNLPDANLVITWSRNSQSRLRYDPGKPK